METCRIDTNNMHTDHFGNIKIDNLGTGNEARTRVAISNVTRHVQELTTKEISRYLAKSCRHLENMLI